MKTYSITLPAKDYDIKKLNIGDKVFLNGIIFGARDATLMRIFQDNIVPPIDFSGGGIFYCGPVVKKENNKYKVIAAGPTTSLRMEKFTKPLIEKLKIKIIVGKGELKEETTKAMKENNACYIALCGGISALISQQIVRVENVFFEDLMPQCLWVFMVKNLGPGIVAIDSKGNNIFHRHLTPNSKLSFSR